MKLILGAVSALSLMTSGAMAQEECASDGESIDCAITALYDVISGPVGEERDFDRMRAMFLPGHNMGQTGIDQEGVGRAVIFDVEGYIERSGPWLVENGFTEVETRRRTHQFGNMATVLSAYEGTRQDTGETFLFGINTIVLFQVEGEWKIASILWRQATEDWPVESGFEFTDTGYDHGDGHHD